MQGEADYLNQLSPIRHYSLSPDMFDDINDTIPRYKRKSINHIVDTREIQKSNDLNIANSFDPVTIDIDSTEIKDFVSFENIEENVNTLSNTPQSNKSKKKSINHFDVKKTKSNLSIFIEQFQMENAKSDFDTDSDITIIPIPSKFKRNPFNINNDSPDQSFRVNETAIVNGKLEKEKDVWDKFDCNVTNFQLDTKSTSGDSDDVKLNFDAMVDLTQLLEDNKENCTEKSVKNNSMNGNVNNTEEIVQNDISLITKDLSKHNANVMNLDNTRAQSDENENSNSLDISTDGGELSMYTMYKKGHKNNSIIKYRNFLKTCALNNSVKSTSEDDNYESDDNMDKENITLHSDVNIGSGNIIISEKEKEIISNLENSGHQSVPQSPTNFNNTIDNNNEDQNDFSVNITSPINRQRSTCKLKSTDNPNKLRYSKLESNINTEVVRHNLSMSSPTREINETNLIESPILIYSSPEIDILNVETRKNKVNNNVSSLEEFSNNSSIFEKHIYLANVHINNYDDDKSNKKINESTITNNVGTTEIETIEEQLPTKQRIRKFQRKSMSDTNLDINEKSTKNNASHPFISLSQSSLCNCGDKQISEKLTSPTIIRDSITPPPNYDGMETDELHAELRKYGLKLQKRSRAIKLLTYIYNELHPTEISISKKVEPVPPVIDSDDEEPPMKRKSYDKSNTNSDYRYDLPLSQSSAEESSVVIIDKETLFDESEPLTAINEALNIKNVFFKLIKDQKELHNKILTYEPLCIEFLHSMLKQEGFKCNMNTLMDFLDEQCITFYCQDMKYKRNRKK
ncbi:PREDICTED: putative uncharacterized protein DDB_G0282133 [Dufourea novaeangliae]|nr:PREDICTED: putative uncharacterized protein DDB_G0282133 [Dufourea novaeangliae]